MVIPWFVRLYEEIFHERVISRKDGQTVVYLYLFYITHTSVDFAQYELFRANLQFLVRMA